MNSFFKVYKTLLHRYPYTCQAIQTGILMGAGDVIAQTVVEKQSIKNLNYTRTIQFFGVGTFLVGPTLTVWYATLNRYVGSGGKSVALKKVALDQVCFAPICIAVFLTCINLVHGKSVEETKQQLREDYFDILLTNYKIWPAVQLANFYFIPLHFQVLLAQAVALSWNAYLSYKTRPKK